jgi:hypothetical protein
MVHYGPYEYSDSEVLKLTEYLKSSARQQRPVHYDDAFAAAKEFGLCSGPRDQRLWHLLDLISETEVAAGRHALSAIVVIKSGDGANRPGSGFFELERALGRYREDDERTWLAELDGLFNLVQALRPEAVPCQQQPAGRSRRHSGRGGPR